jgi:Arylsulfotransferase (ASST)
LTTDADSRVSVMVDDGETIWERHFYDYGTTHSMPLLGFKPGRTSTITVTVRDRYANTATASPLTFITDPLPNDFPKMALLESKPEKMEPGYTLCRIVKGGAGTDYLTILNSVGEVVWYLGNSADGTSIDVRQLENGDLFYPTESFVELNLLGETVNTLEPPPSLLINVHDSVPTSHGTILYLSDSSRTVTNFPTSTTDPNAPLADASVTYNQVVEISATNGVLLNTWSLIDMLDPDRIDYLAQMESGSWDAEHANAVIEDPKDNGFCGRCELASQEPERVGYVWRHFIYKRSPPQRVSAGCAHGSDKRSNS